MGYREDVALVYSPEGWNQFLSLTKALPYDIQVDLVSLLDEADDHFVNGDGAHMIVFYDVKVSADDFQIIMDTIHQQIDGDHFKATLVGEDGSEDYYGHLSPDPFGAYISHTLNFDTSDANRQSGSGIVVEEPPDTLPSGCAGAPPVVDDHTCSACGNTKCSKREKSCWKCGAPISC